MGKPTTVTLKDLENFLSSRRSAPREGGGISRAASALRRAEEERQAQRSVFNQPREVAWRPDHERPGGHALEAPMISPDDLFGTGIPTKIAMAIKGAAPLVGGLGVIKNKGGNWLTGSVEGALGGLKMESIPLNPHAYRPETVAQASAMNNWIDKQLTRYVKNEMATPEDPIRALAERGILHYEPMFGQAGADIRRGQAAVLRQNAGFPLQGEAKTHLGQKWEDYADNAIGMPKVADLSNAQMTDNAWLRALPDETRAQTKLHEPILSDSGYGDNFSDRLGFSHLTDELANALNPESGLPRHLLLDPKSMDRVSVPQAVERVSQINAWRAAQKAEADMLRANNAATVLHKEYPDKGFKWVELKSPEAKLGEGYSTRQQYTRSDGSGPWEVIDQEGRQLSVGETEKEALGLLNRKEREAQLQDALKYEGDTMGHCVGGYCDDVASGRSKIYSLRDAKGQPHVTIEVQPKGLKYERIDPEMGDRDLMVDMGENMPRAQGRRFQEWLENDYTGDNLAEEVVGTPWEKFLPPKVESPRIVQIKGKQNKAPNPEYLPFVQDFVKSGKWSDVGDLQNAGLQRAGWAPDVLERMKAHGIEAPEYGTADEINAALNALNKAKGFAHGGSVRQTKPFTVQDLQAIIAQINQEHINAA